MKLPLYAIRDVRSSTFSSPYVGTNDYTFQRTLAEQVLNGGDRAMAFAPKDYDVYKIGEYDLDTGNIIAMSPVELISNVSEVLGTYGYKKE